MTEGPDAPDVEGGIAPGPGPMSRPDVPDARRALAGEYAAALREYVSGGGEAALARAHELGRAAATEEIGILELATVHHEAMASLLDDGAGALRLDRAARFLVESLSPFEAAMRAYRANARTLGLGEALAREDAEIDRAREQLRALLDATTALIYLKDGDGRYLFVNRAFQEAFGVQREQVIGRADGEALPGPAGEVLRAGDERVLAGRAPEEVEETIPAPDGARTLRSLKFPLVGDDGAPYGICCVATDVAEHRRRDQELRRAVEAAEAASRELESFSYSVAHDLRAPLRSIDGFGQALLEDYADRLDAQGMKYLGYLRESAQHMARLIDDLLTLSRVSRGELMRDRVDLSAICRAIAARLDAAEPARRVEVVVQDGVFAHGDARLLRAALENLLANAWKFTDKRAEAHIEFGADPAARPPVYFVRDDGAGFDMAYADKLFGVFQRLHPARDFEGTGIGLATVDRIVRRHGGRAWAEGEVGRGACFYFTLEPDP